MIYTCQVCKRTLPTRAGEQLLTHPVPYIAAVRTDSLATKRGRTKLAELEALQEAFTATDGLDTQYANRPLTSEETYQLERFRREMASPEVFYCCADCADNHSGRGRYEGNRGRNEIGTALVLESLAIDSAYDESMGNEETCDMIGRYLLFVDYSGFVTFKEFSTWLEAYAKYEDLYADGLGYQEDDVVISSDGCVYFGSKELDVSRHWNSDKEITDTRRYAAIALEMHRRDFYPNVWEDYGHGLRLCQDFYARTAGIDAILNAQKEEV